MRAAAIALGALALASCTPPSNPATLTPAERLEMIGRLCGETVAAKVSSSTILEDLAFARSHGLPYSPADACLVEEGFSDMRAGIVTMADIEAMSPSEKARQMQALQHKQAVTQARLNAVKADMAKTADRLRGR